jgi:hypothetical protein
MGQARVPPTVSTCSRSVEAFFVVEVGEAVVLPPGGLLLAAEPFEIRGQESGRVLLWGAVGRFRGHAGEEPFGDRPSASGAFVELFRRGAVADFGAREVGAAGHEVGAEGFEPVAGVECGDAVLAVVGLDGCEGRGLDGIGQVALEGRFDGAERGAGVG